MFPLLTASCRRKRINVTINCVIVCAIYDYANAANLWGDPGRTVFTAAENRITQTTPHDSLGTLAF